MTAGILLWKQGFSMATKTAAINKNKYKVLISVVSFLTII